MATLLLFIDGIGIGRDDPEENPFAAPGILRLAPLAGGAPADGAAFRALDATLGVPGLPQSATGQTTLFTGVNAARGEAGIRERVRAAVPRGGKAALRSDDAHGDGVRCAPSPS